MRRSLAAATALAALMALTPIASAGEPYGTYRDEFNEKGYNGSDGTEYWGNDPWKELGDDGSPTSGAVFVDSSGQCASGKCLKVFSEGGETLKGVGAKRHADTSVFDSFELCYDIGFEGDDELTDAVLTVEKSVDGGNQWYQLASYPLYDGFWQHPSHWIGDYDSMIVRFTVTGDMVGELYIDDVELKGELVEEPTTTSSTSTTSTSSTTTTTRPTTTTTVERTTTTTEATTTSTTTTIPTTTTTEDDSTSTTEAVIVVTNDDRPGGGDAIPPENSGIRETTRGVQASFDRGLFGDIAIVAGFNNVDHQVDFRMAAEIIGASWVWLVILALVLAYAIVSGLERRRSSAEGASSS